ncbi:MAG: hypothetical protein ACRCZ1_07445 [Cetobacterium sp.]
MTGYVNYNKTGLIVEGKFNAVIKIDEKNNNNFIVETEKGLFHVCQEQQIVTKIA